MKISLVVRLGLVALGLAGISLWIGQQAYGWMPVAASTEALLVDDLFSFLTTLGAFIFLGVAGTLLYSVVFQRAGKYDDGDGPAIEGNLTLEVVWTLIPLCLVLWIAVYSYRVYDQMGVLGPMEHIHLAVDSALAAPPAAAPETIEVRARQWAWEFYYPQQQVSSTELHLPNHRRIHLTLTSEDVLHGLYIPAFRLKQDIIPGRAIDFAFTPIREGTYRLRDSQYSGTYFAAMQTNVVVESASAYQQWLDQVARQPRQPAPNPAYEEYQASLEKGARPGWKTVVPAPPPQVNDF
ncbi:MAG: cytochrome c oxidase subunit II [Nodosilinea sp.]